MTVYEFSINVRIFEIFHKGTAKLTLTSNPNGSCSYELLTSIVGLCHPNIFDIKGVGFLNTFSFNSSYKSYILNFDIVNGVLNFSDVQQNIQLQGVQTNPQPQPQPGQLDTNYNTYNNFNGSSCSKCGGYGAGCGVTNIINLNNRND